MVAKFFRIIIFKKFFFFLFLFFSFFLVSFLNMAAPLRFTFKFFDFRLLFSNNFHWIFFLDKRILLFIFIVCFVTCLVSLYREVYIDSYNNKKFFTLILLFFGFMGILSSGGSWINFFFGWEGLGLSSLCLIIFYPNKNTLFNSILTIFFNRLGDVCVLIVICYFLMVYSLFFFLSSDINYTFLLLILICRLTKRAQIPISSWLPAAMSAPTPISAIVHSSTLVTAGILLNHFFLFNYISFRINEFLQVLRFCSFLIGGILGVLELDFKKTIAFSTMRQIRMIIFFCSLNFLSLALGHMLFHAFFKTLLFVCSGLMFIFFFGRQSEVLIKSLNYRPKLLGSIFFLSVYIITGFIFSSSFFTKDVILENYCSFLDSFIFFLMVLGRILTIIYSSKLMLMCLNFLNFIKIFCIKKYFFNFIMIFVLILTFSGLFFKDLFFLEYFPILRPFDLIFINLILFSPTLFSIVSSKGVIFFFPLEVYFLKHIAYSFFGNFFSRPNSNLFFQNDNFMFKTFYFNVFKLISIEENFKTNFYSLLLIFFLFWVVL